MSSYNVKLFEYGDTRQVRYYHQSITKKERTYTEQYDIEYREDGGYVMKKKRTIDITPKKKREKEENETETVIDSKRLEFMKEHSIRTCTNRAKHKIYEISRANRWEWFITLTFNPQIINSTDYDQVKSVTSEFFHAMRKRSAPDLKYLIVPELHLDGKKYHFHGILSNIGNMQMQDSGIEHNGKIVYNLKQWHFGFSTATKVTDTKKVASYITKYITKELCHATDGRHRYLNSANCNRPVVTEYEMSHEEYAEALDGLYDNITNMKTVRVPCTYNSVEYVEICDL